MSVVLPPRLYFCPISGRAQAESSVITAEGVRLGGYSGFFCVFISNCVECQEHLGLMLHGVHHSRPVMFIQSAALDSKGPIFLEGLWPRKQQDVVFIQTWA